jgi:acetate kinase
MTRFTKEKTQPPGMTINDPLNGSANEAERATKAKTVEAGSEPFSVLTINGGSSSIKFALYQAGKPLKRVLYGRVDRIGLSGTNMTFTCPDGRPQASLSLTAADHKSAANFLIDWLE